MARILEPGQSIDSLREISANASAALNRPLTRKQITALDRAIRATPSQIYTSSERAAENTALKKSGFSFSEIQKLHQKGILGNSIVDFAGPVPKQIKLKDLRLKGLNAATVKELRSGKEYSYVISDQGHVYLSNSTHELADDSVWIVRDGNAESTQNGFLVKEAGQLTYDNRSRNFVFKANYALDTSKDELSELVSSVTNANPEAKVTHMQKPEIAQAHAVNCLDIISAQSKGKNFVLNKFLSDNAVMSTAIVATELGGANRLSSQQGREVVASDYIGANLSIAINGTVGKYLALNNAALIPSLAGRAATGLGMIQIQKHVYEGILEQNSEERADKIAMFDRGHFAARILVNHQFEKFLINGLPNLILNSCIANSKMKVFISPRSIRLYERGSSALIYYGLRKQIVDE